MVNGRLKQYIHVTIYQKDVTMSEHVNGSTKHIYVAISKRWNKLSPCQKMLMVIGSLVR